MADPTEDDTPVNLLVLDGGGIRGVSELLILHEIMSRLQFVLKLDDLPLPCDYFDLIGGTSTGGLRMSTEEALMQYSLIAGKIFSKENKKWKSQDGTFKASTLEKEVKRLVEFRTEQSHSSTKVLDLACDSGYGKAFVCAILAKNMERPRLFRTYEVSKNASTNCEIWEAARATAAVPTFFKRISIGDAGQISEEFFDGGLRCNNPVKEVLEEARILFGGNRRLRYLVSIGTGHTGTIGLQKPDTFQKVLPINVVKVLQQISTDCENTAEDMERRFPNRKNRYFKLSVRHGAEQISLEEWKKIDEVKGHTIAYLEGHLVDRSVDAVVRKLQIASQELEVQNSEDATLDDVCML